MKNKAFKIIFGIIILINQTNLYSQQLTRANIYEKTAQILTESYLISSYGDIPIFREYYLNVLNGNEHLLFKDSKVQFSEFIIYGWTMRRSSYNIYCLFDTSNNKVFITKEGFLCSEKTTLKNYQIFIKNYKNIHYTFPIIDALFIPNEYNLTKKITDSLGCTHKNPGYKLYNEVLDFYVHIRVIHSIKCQVYSEYEKRWINYFNYVFPFFDRQIGPPFK